MFSLVEYRLLILKKYIDYGAVLVYIVCK